MTVYVEIKVQSEREGRAKRAGQGAGKLNFTMRTNSGVMPTPFTV
jgi:hypothetical protein